MHLEDQKYVYSVNNLISSAHEQHMKSNTLFTTDLWLKLKKQIDPSI